MVDVLTFHESLKRHCEKQKRLNPDRMCEQCCLRLYCHLAPTSITHETIDDVWLYLCQSSDESI